METVNGMRAEPARAADTRAQIIAVAEQHFRTYGYTKTTVADIARACGMSPANVYRFFDSKAAINEAIAGRLLSEIERKALEIARRPEPAGQRVRDFLVEIHRMTCDRYIDQTRVHEMVEAALREQWEAIKSHVERMRLILRDIVADGMARGEFAAGDAEAMGSCAYTAMVKFFHPALVSEDFGEHLAPAAEQMATFILLALGRGTDGRGAQGQDAAGQGAAGQVTEE